MPEFTMIEDHYVCAPVPPNAKGECWCTCHDCGPWTQSGCRWCTCRFDKALHMLVD